MSRAQPPTADEVTQRWIRDAYGDDYPRDIFGELLPDAWRSIPEPLKSHYVKLHEVAQAAWDYVNPPDGRYGDRVRYDLLRNTVHQLRVLERRIQDEEKFR